MPARQSTVLELLARHYSTRRQEGGAKFSTGTRVKFRLGLQILILGLITSSTIDSNTTVYSRLSCRLARSRLGGLAEAWRSAFCTTPESESALGGLYGAAPVWSVLLATLVEQCKTTAVV